MRERKRKEGKINVNFLPNVGGNRRNLEREILPVGAGIPRFVG